MKKKRKGSGTDDSRSAHVPETLTSNRESQSSNHRSHHSLEDYARLKKRCKEDVGAAHISSFKSRIAGIATAPPCGISFSIPPGRGHKRKIGCIDIATQIGRKKNIEDDYVKGATIGHGKFGSVFLCQSRTSGVEFACKTLRKGEEIVHREVEIMQHLSGHPGVVTLQAVYEDPESFHLVMELCSGGRLIDQIVEEGQYSEHRVANILREVMLVIKYCHDMGVVHRDVKPENILLTTSGQLKLADFGLAMRIVDGQSLTGLAGSPAYVAPEVLLGNYSEKVDVWSAGVLLHILLVGVLPFKGDSLEAVFEAIKNVKLDFHTGLWASVSKPARDLIGRMLTRDVSTRITTDEVLRHPWILLFTARTLKTLPVKSKLKNQGASRGHLITTPGRELDANRISIASHSSSQLSSESLACTSEDREECGLVDALSVAISHVTISKPKKSRICSPTGPIEQQCSSNKSNSLCRAF